MRRLWKALKVWLLWVAAGSILSGLCRGIFGPADGLTLRWPATGALWFMFIGAAAAGLVGLFGVVAFLSQSTPERCRGRLYREPGKKKKRGENVA